ncbi:hypothetical protein LXL04_024313 [Taraxacum kok-saghyz]
MQFKMVRLHRTLLCCVFIILLVQTSEARKLVENLKCTKKYDEVKHVNEANGVSNPGDVPSPYVDAFRPTKPGHSPGVGHSIHELEEHP